MDFPISNLMDRAACLQWIEAYFHPEGLKCPHCQAPFEQARWFRKTQQSDLEVYRCQACQGIYNLYSGTVFEHRHLRPQQAVLLVRGALKGEPSKVMAAELGLDYITVLQVRRKLQENAQLLQSEKPLPDFEAESDEMFQNAGEKR